MSTHINSYPRKLQLDKVPDSVWAGVPGGWDVRDLARSSRTIFGTRSRVFDVNAPVLARLSRTQAEGNDPTAEVIRLTYSEGGGFRIKVKCPFCGVPHYHGGGSEIIPIFGHRVADCGRGGYALIAGAGK